MPETPPHRNPLEKFCESIYNVIDTPITWVREKIVEPNQQHYPWYHQKFRRVPTIDECYTHDVVCKFEADAQYKRDRKVDSEIVQILRERYEDCVLYERPDDQKCLPLYEVYKDAAGHWFTKYGDLGAYHDAKSCYMKQKHRLIWERRHGPVGTGMKNPAEVLVDE